MKNYSTCDKTYYENGNLRTDGTVLITYYENGNLRTDGTVLITYYENGNLKLEEYYLNGERIEVNSDEEFKRYVKTLILK